MPPRLRISLKSGFFKTGDDDWLFIALLLHFSVPVILWLHVARTPSFFNNLNEDDMTRGSKIL